MAKDFSSLVQDAIDPPELKAMRDAIDSPALKAMRDAIDPPELKAMREFQDSPMARAIRGLEESRATGALKGIEDSPMMKAIRGLEDSPTMRAIRGFEDSPTMRAIREFQDSPTMRAIRELQDSPTMRAIREFQDSPTMRAIREFQDSPTMGAIRGFVDSPTMRAIRDLQQSPGMAAMARTSQWANQLAVTGGLAEAMPHSEVLQLRQAATGVLSLSTELDRLRLNAVLGVQSLSSELQATRLKLSTLAGAGEVLGFAAKSSWAAYEQLFGDWRTRPDLPEKFWRDPLLRRQEYRDAEVDPGLIETTPAAAIEVVIESGFAAGASGSEVSVALLDVAGLSVKVRSSSPGSDAYRAISVFERALRALIAGKLMAAVGPKWFKQRVDGAARQKALDLRAAAMANGERDTELLSYLDLGDLIPILLRKDNWDETFGHIFPNRDRLKVDLEALVASRRPTMHSREVDAVRLVELICIISRLSQWISSDGEWKRIAESED